MFSKEKPQWHSSFMKLGKLTQTDLFCLPHSENFGISEQSWVPRTSKNFRNWFFCRTANRINDDTK
jgi:hypothetical protein